MARIRTIKPEFFTSESVLEVSPIARIFFIGLWCEADREGFLRWKLKSLKYRYLPADNINIEDIESELINANLIELKDIDGSIICRIPGFKRHQVINNREAESEIADAWARVKDASKSRESGRKEGKEGNTRRVAKGDIDFDDFWNVYPRKVGKADAEKKWPKLSTEDQQSAISDCQTRYTETETQFIPHGSTYLNKQFWLDNETEEVDVAI